MSVRVVARIRPLLKAELDKDTIVEAASIDSPTPNVIRIPNPKNASEGYSFQFNSVYDNYTTQQVFFDGEIAPTVKHLYAGFDVTIFAYGVTGTGKTHTMRGGKSLADRGVIPRLLSSVYRRARKIEKDSNGETSVEVTMSYYEIYNDRVFDLFEPPEKRTLAGLPIRDNHGKTVVAGLTERPCTTLKEFESLYDQANVNRSTSATKLNAHSSRSHAILCVKLSQTTGDQVIVSNASAIDLAGSEDNRRTDNDKARLVESSSINKSLFVLAQCVEAISKKQSRIPYRESKMTRILSLGQNNGLTVMILNLAPVRSYHLDTLSSLNFANRTKKIEVREVENEPIFKGASKPASSIIAGTGVPRQPLRSLPSARNVALASGNALPSKPAKAFAVYADKSRLADPKKRNSDTLQSSASRPTKLMRPLPSSNMLPRPNIGVSRANIEEMIDKMVEEKLANRALSGGGPPVSQPQISDELQRRLDSLEARVGRQEDDEDERADGLQYLLMAKQHQVRGEDASALKMYQLAVPYFPRNEKLARKVSALQEKVRAKRLGEQQAFSTTDAHNSDGEYQPTASNDYENDDEDDDDDDAYTQPHRPRKLKPTARLLKPTSPTAHALPPLTSRKLTVFTDANTMSHAAEELNGMQTPRTSRLLSIINSRDPSLIRQLRGVGPKRADAIVGLMRALDANDTIAQREIASLAELAELSRLGHAYAGSGADVAAAGGGSTAGLGMSLKMVEGMRAGIVL